MSISPSLSALLFAANEVCVLRGDIVDTLIKCGDGDGALLYLYLVRKGSAFSEQMALRELGFTQDRLDRAVFTLGSLTLTENTAAPQTKPQNDIPVYRPAELRSARGGDRRFSAVCDTAESVLGRTLTEAQLRTLFTVYDHLQLPAEVIIELLTYLKREKGAVKRSDIEREACLWADMGLYSAQDAALYLSRRETERPLIRAMQEVLGIGGREATDKESAVLSRFIAQGFAPDAIALAAQRTQQVLGKFSWKYMQGIVTSWDQMGVHTLSEITAADPERTSKKTHTNSTPTPAGKMEDWEAQWLAQVKNRRQQQEE